jgi:predicted RNA binding protein YcfA (HicA-like mRNA interferase family)
MKVSEVLRLLHEDGWKQARMKGGHRQFRHPSKPGTVTVAGKSRVDIRLAHYRAFSSRLD